MKKLFLSIAATLGLITAPASAAVVVDIFDDGGDLVVNYSGSIDVTGLTLTGSASANGFAEIGTLLSGAPFQAGSVSVRNGFTNIFNGQITSGDLFFTANGTTDGLSFTTSGDTFGFSIIYGIQGSILLGPSYVSGEQLSGSATFSGASIGSQSLIEGTHIFNLPNDVVTLNIGVTSVPLPASVLLLLGGLGGLLCLGRRRRALS